MWDDEEEERPIIESGYARQNPRKCARYMLDVLARCLQERQGRVVRMIPAHLLRKKYGLAPSAMRDYCINHHVLREVHVEMVENEFGDQSPRLVLYVDEIEFEKQMALTLDGGKAPPGWQSVAEISAQWREQGIYVDTDHLRHFCQRQRVQDARIAGRAFTPSSGHKQVWCAEPSRLLKLWEEETNAELA